jgi:hypothetical protein
MDVGGAAMKPTYDEIRASAQRCAGGCGLLVTAPVLGRFLCHACRAREWDAALKDCLRRGQPDVHAGEVE